MDDRLGAVWIGIERCRRVRSGIGVFGAVLRSLQKIPQDDRSGLSEFKWYQSVQNVKGHTYM